MKLFFLLFAVCLFAVCSCGPPMNKGSGPTYKYIEPPLFTMAVANTDIKAGTMFDNYLIDFVQVGVQPIAPITYENVDLYRPKRNPRTQNIDLLFCFKEDKKKGDLVRFIDLAMRACRKPSRYLSPRNRSKRETHPVGDHPLPEP